MKRIVIVSDLQVPFHDRVAVKNVASFIAKARKGDLKAYEILLDRLEGRPKQTTDITADIKGNVQITIEPDADCQPIKD